MARSEWLTRPVGELAAHVRSGEVTSRELVEAALEQIEAKRHLNAFTYVDAEAALAAADAVVPGDPRPFAGVPIAIKDLTPVAGQPLTNGSDLFGDYRAPEDAYAVRRLREAGFIFVGRTNTPEFGLMGVTEPRRFGASRNPWNPERTPGGSSGGAAAAVAGGMVPIATATDGGGSTRIPAACCGLVGLKPSRGRISHGPALGDSIYSNHGVVTRTVLETAQLLDVMAGYEPGDATWAPPPAEPFAVSAVQAPPRLRIALMTHSPSGTVVDAECVAAAVGAARQLADLGHSVEEAAPPDLRAEQFGEAFRAIFGANVIATRIAAGEAIRGRAARPGDVEAVTWHYHERVRQTPTPEYIGAVVTAQAWTRRIVRFWDDYDLLLTPAMGQRPLPVGHVNPDGADPLAELQKMARFSPFTAAWNLTGQPAIALPFAVAADGLPAGVQLVGPPLADGLLLSVGAQLEAAGGWNRPLGPVA